MKTKKIPDYDWEFEDSIESDDGESIIRSTVITVKGSCAELDIPLIIEDFVTRQARKESDCLGQDIKDYENFIRGTTIGILKDASIDMARGTIEFDWIEPKEEEEEPCVDEDVEWDEWGPRSRK